MTVLVLGANGFIGSHVVDALVESGYRVKAFGKFTDEKNILFKSSENVEIVSGDFMNHEDIRNAIKGVGFVIHAISTTNPVTSENDPIIDIETNILGSVRLFEEIVLAGGIERIVFLSSGGTVYGENKCGRSINELDLTCPVSPYGIGKLTIENYLHYFDKKYNQKHSVFRISNPYGERQPKIRKQGVIPIFLNKITNGEKITVFGDGSMVRDYIYVKDVADIIALSLKKQLKHSTYNLGFGRGYSINEVISEIENTIKKKANVTYIAPPSTFVESSVLDTTRLKKEFHGLSLTNLHDGIKKTLEGDNYEKC
jgi:UDP-glucose 4-epimerase